MSADTLNTETTEFEFTLFEKTDHHVARVIINRPEKRNTFSREVYRDLRAALELAKWDDDIKVVILKGAGEDFSAGHDLSQVGFVYGFGTAKSDRRPSQRTRLSRDFEELIPRRNYLLFFPK